MLDNVKKIFCIYTITGLWNDWNILQFCKNRYTEQDMCTLEFDICSKRLLGGVEVDLYIWCFAYVQPILVCNLFFWHMNYEGAQKQFWKEKSELSLSLGEKHNIVSSLCCWLHFEFNGKSGCRMKVCGFLLV